MIIETERLLLRPFQEGDEEDVFEYLNEPAVNCFASMKLHSLEEAREEVLKRSSETEYYFAIVLKESGKVIGEIDAYPEPADVHGADSEMDTFSPCWMLNKAYHGKGYAYEAAYAFFDYLFLLKVLTQVENNELSQLSEKCKKCIRKLISVSKYFRDIISLRSDR